MKVGAFRLNVYVRRLCITGQHVPLTAIEFEVLTKLMKHHGKCVRRDILLKEIWGIDYETGTNFLDVHIHALRKKIKQAGQPPHILTIRGVGYQFAAPAYTNSVESNLGV